MKLGKIRFLEVEGSNYETGKAIGRKQKEEIKFLLDNLIIKDELLKRSKAVLERHKKAFPAYVDELRGMADGAGADFMKLFTFNCFEYQCIFKSCEEKCTTLLWTDDKNKFIGHNEDCSIGNYGKLLLVKAELGKSSFFSLNYPALLCGDAISVNSYGMVHAIDSLYPKEQYEEGFARGFIGRALLESKSINESRKILSSFPNFEGMNIIIYSQMEGKCVSIETYNKKIAETLLVKGAYAHSNSYLSSKFKDIPQEDVSIAIFKTNRAEELANRLRTPSFDNIKTILSDHLRFPESVCRHPKDKDLESPATLASVIVNLKDLSFFVANGNPCSSKFYKFKL